MTADQQARRRAVAESEEAVSEPDFEAVALKLVRSDAPLDRYISDIANALRKAVLDERERLANLASDAYASGREAELQLCVKYVREQAKNDQVSCGDVVNAVLLVTADALLNGWHKGDGR